MKTTTLITRRTSHLTLAATAICFALVFNVALAQEKGGELLVKLSQLQTAADLQKVAAGDTVLMSCPKCKDAWMTVATPPVRRGQEPTSTMMRHECPGCGAKIEIRGAGKNAQSVVKHTCKQCGSQDAYCCVLKKNAQPTTGMDAPAQHQH